MPIEADDEAKGMAALHSHEISFQFINRCRAGIIVLQAATLGMSGRQRAWLAGRFCARGACAKQPGPQPMLNPFVIRLLASIHSISGPLGHFPPPHPIHICSRVMRYSFHFIVVVTFLLFCHGRRCYLFIYIYIVWSCVIGLVSIFACFFDDAVWVVWLLFLFGYKSDRNHWLTQ